MLPVGQLVASANANAEIQEPLELGWQNQTWGLVREWCLPPSKNDEPWGWFSFSLSSVLDLSSSGCSLALGNAVLLASFAPACGVPCPVVGWFCLLAAGIKSLNFAVSGWLTAWMGFLASWPRMGRSRSCMGEEQDQPSSRISGQLNWVLVTSLNAFQCCLHFWKLGQKISLLMLCGSALITPL